MFQIRLFKQLHLIRSQSARLRYQMCSADRVIFAQELIKNLGVDNSTPQGRLDKRLPYTILDHLY